MHWNGADFVLRQYFARHYGEDGIDDGEQQHDRICPARGLGNEVGELVEHQC